MKLLQLNAWGGRLEFAIGELIKQEQPDIICLQEAISFHENGSGMFIATEAIKKNYDYPYEAFAPVFSFAFMNGTARFGNVILSRYPIKQTEAVFTHLEHKDDYVWSEHDNNMRNFLHAELDIDGVNCHVLTHHGYWVPDHKNGNGETLHQMDILASYIKPLQGPVILTGDFNLATDSPSLQKLNAMLNNLSVKHRLKTTRTSLTTKTETCDYIFVNDALAVKNFEASDKVVSDHKALILDFELA